MLLSRSFDYSSRPMLERRSDKSGSTSTCRHPSEAMESSATPTTKAVPTVQSHVHTGPMAIPSSKHPNAPFSRRNPSAPKHPLFNMHSRTTAASRRRKHPVHDPRALPPAVAALLAMTSIPPRKASRRHIRLENNRRMSIEELVRDWKNDESLRPACGTSQALNILLEDVVECEYKAPYPDQRSASSDSMPSLVPDDRSISSFSDPATPASLKSHRSSQNLKKEKPRSVPIVEDCAEDHPLVSLSESEDELYLFPTEKKPVSSAKGRSSFKSNLTLSLQSLKTVAVNSISSIGRVASNPPALARIAALPIDDMLWSHPFLFPRFASETRPSTDATPSEAERRYLNPVPLTFEEQEAPFQQALHAPYLAEIVEDAPTIPLQTYYRSRRRGGVRRGSSTPEPEVGRTHAGMGGVRQREVRENSDFLRVVVLEMNMRREGKLEQGRAKIWLPPREVAPMSDHKDGIPTRWIGMSAY